nr:hypothetical protein [Tanacetum cinerariifolium]
MGKGVYPMDFGRLGCGNRGGKRGNFLGGKRDEEVVVGEGVVVTSSSLEMLTNSCLGGILVSLIFLKGLVEEALEEFMVELFEEDY